MKQTNNKIVLFALVVFTGFVLTGMSRAYAHDATAKTVIWQPQNSGINVSLYSVYFINEDIGWVAGESGVILKTIDGGANWQPQTSGTIQSLWSVQFMNDSTGWICGDQGTVLKTTDGGNHWVPKNSSTIFHLTSLRFVNLNTGWVVGSGGTILKTTNGGDNWTQQNSPFSGDILDVDFVDSLYGWATCESGAEITIVKTTDGGDFWQLVTVPMLIPLPAFSVDFIDRNTGWVVGFYEIIYNSMDAGNNWLEQLFGLSSTDGFLSVSFADENNGWTVGYDGVIANTSDGGNLWTAQTSGTTNDLWDVYFPKPDIGWAVGDQGTILKASNPTVIWDTPGNIGDNFVLYDNYPNPFNPSTIIQYEVPKTAKVSLKVYNILGEETRTLVNEVKSPGIHSVVWDGTENDGDAAGSGIYFYRLKSENNAQTNKMILMR